MKAKNHNVSIKLSNLGMFVFLTSLFYALLTFILQFIHFPPNELISILSLIASILLVYNILEFKSK